MKTQFLNAAVAVFLAISFLGCGSDGSQPTQPPPNGTNTGNTWVISQVLPTGAVGELPAIAVDTSGKPHISYLDYSDGFVKYATKTGSTWSVSSIANVANANTTIANGGVSSIAVDAAGNPHVIFYDYGRVQYKYARKIGSSWTITVIPLPNDPRMSYASPYLPCAESSIAVDQTTGVVHIALQMLGGLSGYVLGYWRTGYTSAIAVDDANGNTGFHNSIAVDANGYPRISYEARAVNNLKYARWTGSAFTIETVAPMSLVYWEVQLTSIVIDAGNNPHIAYHTQEGYKYARKSGASWSIQTIPYTSGYPSLALRLASTGVPHLALVGGDLKHAYLNGSAWVTEKIDSNPVQCALAIDRTNKLHVAYNVDSAGVGVLKYATKLP